jgi:UDP-glucose 4-epimerase
MKILVTGGAGFIGSHLVEALIKAKHQVVVIDNLSTGSKERIEPGARFYQLDIYDSELAEVLRREKPEILYHQAAQTVIARSTADPVFDAQQNILGSLNVIVNSVKHGVKKIVYASSGGAVYGEPQYRPADEKHPVRPLSQYGISKHTVEHYLELYGSQYGLNYTILRYGNVYGTGQNPRAEAGVVAIFTGQMLSGQQPTIFGRGDKTRDYVYVADVVSANMLAMCQGDRSIYNIATCEETSDQEIFDRLARLTGYQVTPRYSPVRPGEINRICLSHRKAREELSWQPRYSLEEGLAETVTYYRHWYRSAD